MTVRVKSIIDGIENWLHHKPKDKMVQVVMTRETAEEVALALRKSDGQYYFDLIRNHIRNSPWGCDGCVGSGKCNMCSLAKVKKFCVNGGKE